MQPFGFFNFFLGHAGPSHLNQSSLACPTECYQQNNSSTSNNNNSFNNNKVNKQPQQLKRRRQQRTIATPQAEVQDLGTKNTTTKSNHHTNSSVLPTPAKTHIFSKQNNVVSPKANLIQNKKLESAKTFTEQYSLPDDITITPIIMNPEDGKSLPFSQAKKPERKRKDIVHLIDPRSGQTTTIAKHISSNNIIVNQSSLVESKNVASVKVKPNNAGNVGKISPDLDVIVIGGRKDLTMSSFSNQPQNLSINKGRKSCFAVLPMNSMNRSNPVEKGNSKCTTFITNANTNMVLPLPQVASRSENKTAPKRKGLSLSECIDGLQRKKMRILADTNISITNVTPSNHHNFTTGSLLTQGQISILPGSGNMLHNQQQKPNRKINKPRQRNPSPDIIDQGNALSGRGTSQDHDVGSTIINCNDALLAASALVVPQSSAFINPMINKSSSDGRKPIKLKLSTAGAKITTRSSTQNSKVKTRGKAATVRQLGSNTKIGPVPSDNRLIRFTKTKDNKIINTIGTSNKKQPYYFTTLNSKKKVGGAGNGSSTLTTVNNHVILRIPKNSTSTAGAKSKNLLKVDTGNPFNKWPNVLQQHFQASTSSASASGNMTLAAMKKRAIVKPLSSMVVNGALSSLSLSKSSKTLPTHSHPRWSNGWTFEGKSFEAKVHLSVRIK